MRVEAREDQASEIFLFTPVLQQEITQLSTFII